MNLPPADRPPDSPDPGASTSPPVPDPGNGPPPPKQRGGSLALAVFAGWLADIGGTTVFASLALAVAASFIGEGATAARDLAAFERSGGWQAFGLLFGMSFTALGGYIAARIAPAVPYLAAALTGVASLATGEFLMQSGDADSGLFWVRLVAFVFTLPAALTGAWLRQEALREA